MDKRKKIGCQKKTGRYLVWRHDLRVSIAVYYSQTRWRGEDITHWMPLTAPPEGE